MKWLWSPLYALLWFPRFLAWLFYVVLYALGERQDGFPRFPGLFFDGEDLG